MADGEGGGGCRAEARVVTDYPGCTCLPFASSRPSRWKSPKKRTRTVGYIKVRATGPPLTPRTWQ